jgi:PleD family two-component response regulator
MPPHWILLLDPFRNLINAYPIILEEEHYQVETAINLKEAYELFHKRRYSVVITEYIPPFEDTDEMIHWVKKNSPETYLIMVTNASIDEKTYGKLFAIGVDDFILKPYAPEKILAHIKKAFKQRDLILKMKELERLNIPEQITQEPQGLIFNTAFFKECFRQEMKRSKRHHHPFSLLLIQLPTKEGIGDRCDQFFLELVKIVKKYTREEDVVGKSNGEIGILLPETDQMGTHALIKRLLNLIQTNSQFLSNDVLKSYMGTLSFQSFTYPEQFAIPEPFRTVVEEVEKASPHH